MSTGDSSGETKVYCRRIDAKRTVAEHNQCPYCYGKADEVIPGQHERFCDYRPGVDPIVFGFPSGGVRDD